MTRSPRVGSALIRAALMAYPKRFRERFGQSMVDLYHERFWDARGRGVVAAVLFTCRSVLNVVTSGIGERGSSSSRGGSSRSSERHPRFSAFLMDLRFGVRMLGKHRAMSVTAMTALALGVGLSTTMFSVHQAFLAPLPFENPDELMHLGVRSAQSGRGNVMRVFPRELEAVRETQRSFQSMAAYRQRRVTLSDDRSLPDAVHFAETTPNAFGIVGVQPMLGRAFGESDLSGLSAPVAIISEALWRTRYGGAAEILRRTIRLDGQAYSIVGVMPPKFGFPLDVDVWIPLDLDAVRGLAEDDLENLGASRWFLGVEVFGRLREGVSGREAQVEFDHLASTLSAAFPATNADVGMTVQPLVDRFGLDPAGRVLFTLMFLATVGVLLIACANVANLLVARTIVRSREVAVRAALGAGRWRIVSLLLGEATVLATAGTAVGFAIAVAGVRGINMAMAPFGELPSWMDIGINGKVFLFVVGLTMLTSLAAGILPAVYALRTDVNAVLKDEARGAAGRGLGKLSRSLVVAELTIACALLIGSGFMMKNGLRVTFYDPPYATSDIMTAYVQLPDDRYVDADRRGAFVRDLEERLTSNPEVVVASVSSNLPGTGRAGLAYQADGAVYDRDGELPLTRSISIRPSFFSTFDVGVVRGRPYTDLDLESNERVILVNESFARSAFPDGAALGRRIRFGTLDDAGDWSTIVGIVPDMWTPGGFVYQTGEECVFPVLKSSSNLYVAVRGRGDAASLVSIVRESVAAMDRDIAPTDFLSMKIVAGRHALLYAVFGAAFMISGVASLFLAVLGLYSIMAFAVASRSYEMGVRMALGAKARNVIMLILRQGVSQIAIGLGVGLALGAGLAVALQRVILSVGGDTVDMNPLDPVLFVGIMAILAATGLTACFVPARRATRVDPMIAVRVE